MITLKVENPELEAQLLDIARKQPDKALTELEVKPLGKAVYLSFRCTVMVERTKVATILEQVTR